MRDRTEEFQLAVELVEDCLREGYTAQWIPGPGNRTAIHEAARRWRRPITGEHITATGFKRLMERAAQAGYEPDWTVYRNQRYQQPVATRQLLPAPAPSDYTPGGQPTRVLVIPDRLNNC